MNLIVRGVAGVLMVASLAVWGMAQVPEARADSLQEIVLEAKAKKSGDPDDAMDAARYHDKQKGKGADKQALEWYGKAAEGYLKKGKHGQAQKALDAMKKIDPKSKAVAKLEPQLDEGAASKDKSPAPPASNNPPVAKAPPPTAPPVSGQPVAKAASGGGDAAGQMAAGIKAWRANEFEKARALLRPAADGGNADAQYALGSATYADLKGSRTKANQWSDEGAAEWFRKAAKQGHMGAKFILSVLVLPEYDAGEAWKSEQDALKAKPDPWYGEIQERAALNHPDAMRGLSKAYRFGHGEKQSWDLAESYAAGAGQSGDPEAFLDAFAIAIAARDFKSAEFRSIEGDFRSSTSWEPRNRDAAAAYLRNAADKGLLRARVQLAFLLYRGMQGGENHGASFEEYRKVIPDGDIQTVRYLQRVGGDIFPADDPGAKYAAGAIQAKLKDAAEAEKWMLAGALGYARHFEDLWLTCKVRQAMVEAKLPAGAIKQVDQAVAKEVAGGCAAVKPPAAAAAAPAAPRAAAPAPPPPAPVAVMPVPAPLKPVAGPSLAQGLAALAKGDRATAQPILEAHAQAGNGEAAEALGSMLYNDLKKERTAANQFDVKPASGWFTKAAEAGHVGAAYMVATLATDAESINGNELEKWEKAALADPAQLNRSLTTLANAGHLAAMRALARSARLGHGMAKSAKEFSKWAEQAAEAGDPMAKMDLAWASLGPKDKDLAGMMEVMFPLAFGQTWQARDSNDGRRWLREAAQQGLVSAKVLLATFSFKGSFWPRDLPDSRQWYLQIADTASKRDADRLGQTADKQKDPGAAFGLAVALEKGTPGLPANKTEANKRYKQSGLLYVEMAQPTLACDARKAMAAGKAAAADLKEVDRAIQAKMGKGC